MIYKEIQILLVQAIIYKIKIKPMTIKTLHNNNFVSSLLGEVIKNNKNTNTNFWQLEKPVEIKKTHFSKHCFNFSKKLIIETCKLYRPSINYIDKYFSIYLLRASKKITLGILHLRWSLEKYIKRKKYNTLWQYEQNLKEIDIAYLVLWVGHHRKLTVHDIMEHFNISYHDALRVNKMKKDKLKALEIIRVEQEHLQQLELIRQSLELEREETSVWE